MCQRSCNRVWPSILVLLLLVSCDKEAVITTGVFTDNRDNHVYPWVEINGDRWMAENLVYLPGFTRYEDREGVLHVTANYGVYGYDGFDAEEAKRLDNYILFGCLYGVTDTNVDTLCPDGWHVSTDDEWNRIERLLGGKNLNKFGIRDDDSLAIKLRASTGWEDGLNGTDVLGLGIVPGGYHAGQSLRFVGQGMIAVFATSSKDWQLREGSYSRFRVYRTISDRVKRTTDNETISRSSIRCVKDLQ